LAAGVGSPAPLPIAAQPADSSCYYSTTPSAPPKRFALPLGHTLELLQLGGSEVAESACAAVLRDSLGQERWRGEGFGASLHPISGLDLDGDGLPDAVVVLDVGGGNRCCRQHSILRLGSGEALVAELAFDAEYRRDGRGNLLLLETVAFYDLGPDMASAPVLTRIHRLGDRGLEGVTRRHCNALRGTNPTDLPDYAPEPVPSAEAQRAARGATAPVPHAVERTRISLQSLALQELECGEEDRARAWIERGWPAPEAQAEWARLMKAWNPPAGRS